MDLKQKFREVLLEPPHCILGKKGLNDNKGFINHIEDLLKKHKIIKIKFLKTSTNEKSIEDLIKKITEETNSYLLDHRGRTIIISRILIDKK
ncbi:MAG: YhbY family RNA-binding protein [Candidatus Lokiarchaeota archaeon]|nr:YhbY family RNA-binding protein [Candidatus Lokiarchaeota archaeon]